MNRKSILPIIAGLLFTIAVTTLVDMALHTLNVFASADQPLNDSLALLATSYRIVISIAGAWLTARLAPSKPMQHAIVLGIVGTILGVVGVIATWNLGMAPKWYAITLAVLAIPQCWLGGLLYEQRQNKPTGATN